MQASTEAEEVVLSPQPSWALTSYQPLAAFSAVFGRPQPNTFPDSAITPATMGSEAQAYEYKSTEAAPADWPKIVIRVGSPPKFTMLSRIHSTARR